MYPLEGDPEQADITGKFEFVNALINTGLPGDEEQIEEEPEFGAGCSPSPTASFLPTTEFPGPYNFSVTVDRSEKSSWVYSSLLQQVFIHKDKVLMLQFQMNPFDRNLFIRAVPTYTSADELSKPVNRCPLHAMEDDPLSKAHSIDGECKCLDFGLSGHVLRTYSIDAKYCFDSVSLRHSVLVPVPIPEQGSDFIAIPFAFSCKTSCQSGMQRRPIKVVFTLETQQGKVFGRRVLGVRICSCPKRDMDRMETTKDRVDSLVSTIKSEADQFGQEEALEENKNSNLFRPDAPSISEAGKRAQRKKIVGEIRSAFSLILTKLEELQLL